MKIIIKFSKKYRPYTENKARRVLKSVCPNIHDLYARRKYTIINYRGDIVAKVKIRGRRQTWTD